MPYIIDGYNLLQAVWKMDEEFERLDDVGLCRIVSDYLTRIRDHGHIYFDGLGPPDKEGFADLPGLEVYFSGMEREADDLIEQKIHDNTAAKRLFVVSTDHRIQEAAYKKKANALRCDDFWPLLLKHLDRPAAIPEPREKREGGISEGETDAWMDIFGLGE